MKILLVYPQIPSTFWSFESAVKFVSKKSTEPPLGLVTVAAMLPADWEKKIIDTNITHLSDDHIKWADYLFITGMNVQKESFKKIVRRSNELNTPVAAGGPMVTCDYKEFLGIDHLILNEAEITLPQFLADLEKGKAKHIYQTDEFPDISRLPIPMWELLEMDKYTNMSIQYSRGCPFDCEFCSITMLNGHKPRTKDTGQFLQELDAVYKLGWRGGVFIVDDNFIGNKKKLKQDLLPELVKWSEARGYPFNFGTEASINIADDEELMQLMASAGFDHTFIGIETPDTKCLVECGKKQNVNRDLLSSVSKLHQKGLRVSGGFILGFDHDPPGIFEQLINFIQKSGIITAMVGLLNAPAGTKLFKRLKTENRLLESSTGNNMDGSINFVPKMKYQKLIAGYKNVLETIYSQKEYYERVKKFLQDYQPQIRRLKKITWSDIKALMRSVWILGIKEKGKRYYWKLFFYSLFHQTKKFPMAITMAIYGFHFRQVIKNV